MDKIKYPRTLHLPWSEGFTKKDKVLDSTEHFEGKQVIVTEKMDGECMTFYKNYIHARSLDSRHHRSRDWIKAFHAKMAYLIPEDWRVCGEYLYAIHSIKYLELDSYFQVFSIWDDNNTCLSIDDTIQYCNILGLCPVPVIYQGVWDLEKITYALKGYGINHIDAIEGYVVRIADEFKFTDFNKSVAKFVREGHVQTDENWLKTWNKSKINQCI